jgi:small subunit ribosomal protein S17
MTSVEKSEPESKTDAKNKKDSGKKEKVKAKKEQPKAGKAAGKATSKAKNAKNDEVTEEPKSTMKKKLKTAKEIDKTQAKRIIKTSKPRKVKGRKTVKAVTAVVKPRDIGIDVVAPEESCTDPFCPFHGTLAVRGQIINGIVVTSKMDKTAIIQREVRRIIPKYERYEKRTQNYAVHNPPCLNVQRGDIVRIMECRPLSKSKSFVVIEKL